MAKHNEEDVKDFKSLILKLHKQFPNGSYSEEIVKKVIVTENTRNDLVSKGILSEENVIEWVGKKKIEKKYYTLGANGLTLVSSWKMEDLTDKIILLTMGIIALAVLSMALTAIGIVITFFK